MDQTSSVTELKSQLSKYLRLVKDGEVIEVLERSRPIARLEAIVRVDPGDRESESDAIRERLARDGIVSPARERASAGFIASPPVPCRGDAVRALIEERGDR